METEVLQGLLETGGVGALFVVGYLLVARRLGRIETKLDEGQKQMGRNRERIVRLETKAGIPAEASRS